MDQAAPTIAAFLKLRTAQVTAIPLVDDAGCLTGCLSPSDLRSATTGGADGGVEMELLAAPCEVYLRRAQAQREAAGAAGGAEGRPGVRVSSSGLRVISCGGEATLREAIDLLCDNGVHRVRHSYPPTRYPHPPLQEQARSEARPRKAAFLR